MVLAHGIHVLYTIDMMGMRIGKLALRSFQAMDYISPLVRNFISQTILLPQAEAALHDLDIHNS